MFSGDFAKLSGDTVDATERLVYEYALEWESERVKLFVFILAIIYLLSFYVIRISKNIENLFHRSIFMLRRNLLTYHGFRTL